jgi:hypothetical protein
MASNSTYPELSNSLFNESTSPLLPNVTANDTAQQQLDLGNHGLNALSEAELSKFSPAVLTFTAVSVIIFAILGIVGNLLTIFAIIRSSRLRNVTAAFIIR